MNKQLSLATALLLMVSTHSFAAILNGDFEAGLTSWTTTPGVTTTTNGIVSGSGNESAFINDSNLDLGELDAFFGLDSGTFSDTLDCANELCIEGSGLYQSVSYQAGDVLSFDWATSLENSSSYVDWVAFVVEDTLIQLGNGEDTADNTIFNTEYTFLTSGTSPVGFVVGDGGDGCCGSQMTIDNVAITPTSVEAAVPEPAAIALLGIGLAGIGFSRKKKSA